MNEMELTSTSLRDDSDSNGTAHTILHAQVREEDLEGVLRTQNLGNVAERVNCRTSNALLVRLEQVEQLETDKHPLSRGYKLGTTISDMTDQVDGGLLHLLVSVTTKDRSQARY